MAVYAGLRTDSCGAQFFPVFVWYLRAVYGIEVRFTQLIGSYGPSAGTHGGGLCFDLVVTKAGPRSASSAYAIVVRVARQMGCDATWERPYNWDGRGGILHIHGLGTGCPHLMWQAVSQQVDVRGNRNGLANKGRDTGPRPLSGRTWRQGIAWARGSTSTTPEKGADVAKYRSVRRTKDVRLNKTGPRVVPIKNNGDVSIYTPGKSDTDCTVTFDVLVQGLKTGQRVRARAVHTEGSKVVGAGGWIDITQATPGKQAGGQVVHTATVKKGRRLRLQVDSLGHDVTVKDIRTRGLHFG